MSELIRLSYGGYEAIVAPNLGMNVVSLGYKGRPIFFTPKSIDLESLSCMHYGNPILMPPNRTEGASFVHESRTYRLELNEAGLGNSLHGRLWSAIFKVEESDSRSVTAALVNRGDFFPFSFTLRVKAALADDGLTESFVFTNDCDISMPLTFGLHTSFVCPTCLKVPIKSRWVRNERFIPEGAPVELDERELSYTTGFNPCSSALSGLYTSGGNAAWLDDVHFTVSSAFDQWILWNKGGGKGFVCVEPQCGAVNCLNSKIGLLVLERGESKAFSISVGL
ncbi:MAG: hypothetical protein PHI83_04330 [Sphaerochaetaceae bacterium]|nr:hypothetical protein [Sphaerochaetaceae bacterium]